MTPPVAPFGRRLRRRARRHSGVIVMVMNYTETAEAVIGRHQPNRWWAAFGINRCRQGCGRWPCSRWHIARDRRDRVALDHAALERIAALVEELASLPLNRGR